MPKRTNSEEFEVIRKEGSIVFLKRDTIAILRKFEIPFDVTINKHRYIKGQTYDQVQTPIGAKRKLVYFFDNINNIVIGI